MLKQTFFIGLVIFIFSCSSTQKNSATHPISFLDMQKIKIGNTHFSELEKMFGNPNEVTVEDAATNIWTYKDNIDGVFSDRAKFYIDPTSGAVKSAIWTPDESSGYSNEKELLSKIKKGKFACELSVPPKDHHYVPADGRCYNLKTGLSYVFLSKDREIFAIGFNAPQDARIPARAFENK